MPPIHVIETSTGAFALFDPADRRTYGHYPTAEDARRAAARSGFDLASDLPAPSPAESILAYLDTLGLLRSGWTSAHVDQLAAHLRHHGLDPVT